MLTRTILIWAIIAGALGSILFDRVIIPRLSTVPGFGWMSKLAPNAPIVITRHEEVVLNEGANFIELSKQISNSTVSIFAGTKPNLHYTGNGIIMTSDGIIFTEKKVVKEGREELFAVLNDGTIYPALVRALDPKTEIAVVSIEAKNLPVVSFAPSHRLQAGQKVLAVGDSNREFVRTFASGSATSPVVNQNYLWRIFSTEVLRESFKTDAQLNPENFSGSPIVNLEGKLVGMLLGNGEILISENLQTALISYLSSGKIIRAKLGFDYYNLSKTAALIRGFDKSGVLVFSVYAGSAAAKAGILPNDLIFEVDGASFEEQSFEQRLHSRDINEMKINLLRAGKEIELKVILEPTK